MNIKSFLMLGLVAAGASSFVVTTNSGCNQPGVKCASSRGDFIFRYTYVSGPDDCKALVGEKVGMQTYNAVGNEGKPDLDRSSVAIQADGIGSLRDKAEKKNASDPDPNHHPYALGNFNTNVASGDICTASVLAPAEQDIGKIPGNPDAGVKDSPPTKLAYTWSNVQFLVTAQYYGSQVAADLTISQDGNQCVYKAQGLYPYVDCFKLDENGDPAMDADGNMMVDDSFCAAEANPPAHPTGSGINPDFRVHCDPVLFACVLNSTTFPSIR